MTVIVTGAAGFIGANLVKALNARGETDIIAVDNLTRAEKFRNLVDCEIADYLDKDDFRARLARGAVGRAEVVFHQGACSDTMASDGRYMLDNNFRCSVELLDWCQAQRVPLVYASSASVYGLGPAYAEAREHERPLNVYGYSKFLFDQVVRRRMPAFTAPVIGLRYFNVYGPREAHKARMASVAFHHFNQFRADGRVRLFEGSHGYANGDQRRDFDALRKALAGIPVWILVIDTRGINVWCAAGKKTFTAEEIAYQVHNAQLDRLVSHRQLILPQLAAPGVAVHELKNLVGL
mgnify:CR=1 FL=1